MNEGKMKYEGQKKSEVFLNAYELSKYLRIPLSTIYRLSQQGKIKAVKIGKHWRYARADIEKYLSAGIEFSNMVPRRTEQFIERREYPRINCYWECLYQIYLPPIKNITCQGTIRNISAGGVLLVNVEKHILSNIDIGDPVELDFKIASNGGHKMNINTEARIVRKADEGVAVKFRNIGEGYKKAIIEFVD